LQHGEQQTSLRRTAGAVGYSSGSGSRQARRAMQLSRSFRSSTSTSGTDRAAVGGGAAWPAGPPARHQHQVRTKEHEMDRELVKV